MLGFCAVSSYIKERGRENRLVGCIHNSFPWFIEFEFKSCYIFIWLGNPVEGVSEDGSELGHA